MANAQFVHLHLHSEYSLLDGLSRVEDLVGRASALGMPAIALTDHGVLYGAIDFYLAAKAKGIKPILGVEAYIAPRGMSERAAQDRQYSHLVLLARNLEGYRNLLKLVTRSHLDGYFYRPRIDRDLLAEHAGGLMGLSGCPSGDVARAILRDDPAAAREAATTYRDILGADNFWLELQSHGLLEPDEAKIVQGKLALGRETGIPVVATNDVHYTSPAGAQAQDLLLCIQTNSTLDDPKRMRMERPEFYLKSAEEMAGLFGEIPQALSNTLAVAERSAVELKFDRLNFPKLSHVVPDGVEPQEHLARLCREALPGRYPRSRWAAEERLEYELDVIGKTGFAAYILFVWDFVRWARERKILCGPRGSAAGAIVLYLLGITQVDPLEYGLTFERFLNPERVQMPDIDMDFPDDRRDEVIEYVVQRYGRDHVAQIVTFGRLLARAAIRDVGRALAYPISEVDRVAKLIPTLPIGTTIDQALQGGKELKSLYESQPHIKRLVDAARGLEGVARHASTHAAGVVVSGDPLVEHVPLQKVARGDGAVMTQYHMKVLEKIGLLKLDFLGLANLTMLDRAVKYVRDVRGVDVDLNSLPLDDPRTFEALARGESRTVFQLEGAGITRYLKELKPANVHHLSAMVALYRPGPMAHIPEYIARKEGRSPVVFPHPSLKEVLGETYGLLVYQDQVLQVVQIVAGYSLGQADILRRAMGKKLPEEMKRERGRFLQGAAARGYSEGVANQLWEYIEPFAGYAFNKSHAVLYAQIAFQTAYLKANFPVEWMAAVLTTEALNTEKVVGVVGECRRLGIGVLPPNVNRSQTGFSAETIPNGAIDVRLGIRYGLAAIKNVGEGAVEQIIAERDRGGLFRSFADFCRRVDLKALNKRVLEALVKSGALDDFGARERLLAGLDTAISAAQQAQRASSQGQTSLFDEGFGASQGVTPLEPTDLPRVEAVSERQRLLWEKDVLGLFLSTHPFQSASVHLESQVSAVVSDLGSDSAGQKVTLAGILVGVRRLTTRKGDSMVVAELEDLTGSVEVIAFPRTLERTSELWREDAVLVVEGKLDSRDDRVQVICESAREWVETEALAGSAATMPAARLPRSPAARLAMNGNHGETTVNGAHQNGHTIGHSHPGGAAHTRDRKRAASLSAPAVDKESSLPPTPPTPTAELPTRPAEEQPAFHVHVVVPRSGHTVTDVRLLETVHALIREHPGADLFELVLSAGKKRVKLSGAARVGWTAALEERFRSLLGNANVEVDEVATPSAEPPGSVEAEGSPARDDLDSVRNWWS